MQLAAFSNNQFTLGHAAMMVNEGLPQYIVSQIERTTDLRTATVGMRQRPLTGARSSVIFKNHPCAEAIACEDASEADWGR
jgi:UDP-N-acetyl-D-mannosaminuronic acid dehydrogenase